MGIYLVFTGLDWDSLGFLGLTRFYLVLLGLSGVEEI